MKKVLLSLSVLAMLGSVSCKKDDKKKTNSWTLAGTGYSVISANSSNGAFGVVDPSGTACTFDFEGVTNPPTAGSYKVVSGPSIGSGQVMISAIKGGVGYVSLNTNTQLATVTVSGGKITVSVPEIILKNVSGGTDEVTFSANEITQTN